MLTQSAYKPAGGLTGQTQGIEAEIPQKRLRRFEELERKARPRAAGEGSSNGKAVGMEGDWHGNQNLHPPKNQISKQTPLAGAYAKRYFQTLRQRLKPAGGRVCQVLFSNPKARSKCCFGYANAERMRNPLAG
jgi:hypothetical protein